MISRGEAGFSTIIGCDIAKTSDPAALAKLWSSGAERPLLAWFEARCAFSATVIVDNEGPLGFILLPAGNRTSPMTLEEARGVRVLRRPRHAHRACVGRTALEVVPVLRCCACGVCRMDRGHFGPPLSSLEPKHQSLCTSKPFAC